MCSGVPGGAQCTQDVEDVQREVSVMELLKGHPNVACLEAVFEDEEVSGP